MGSWEDQDANIFQVLLTIKTTIAVNRDKPVNAESGINLYCHMKLILETTMHEYNIKLDISLDLGQRTWACQFAVNDFLFLLSLSNLKLVIYVFIYRSSFKNEYC